VSNVYITKSLGPLHDLAVSKGLYPDSDDKLNVRAIARELNLSMEACYKWFRRNRIPPRHALMFCERSDGRLRMEDFSPYFA
jgi:hypothetical protein